MMNRIVVSPVGATVGRIKKWGIIHVNENGTLTQRNVDPNAAHANRSSDVKNGDHFYAELIGAFDDYHAVMKVELWPRDRVGGTVVQLMTIDPAEVFEEWEVIADEGETIATCHLVCTVAPESLYQEGKSSPLTAPDISSQLHTIEPDL